MLNYSFLDQLCLKTDVFLKTLSGHLSPATQQNQKTRENPAQNIPESDLTTAEKKQIAGYMRVNYAGEICAQALYKGQALTARNPELTLKLEQAALEETDHLYWCQSRLDDLNCPVSILNPLWYLGSFMMGVTAGLLGDKWNLGFLEETEKQVTTHLEHHLDTIALHDHKTRAILEKMHAEESEHAHTARQIGAADLPAPVKLLMKFTSSLMTKTSYWI